MSLLKILTMLRINDKEGVMKIVDLRKIEYDSKTFVPKELYFSQESKDRADKHIGNKYNHLTVLEYIGNTTDSKKETIGKFNCDCGKTCLGGLSDVVHGYKTTCGCKCGRPQEESEKNDPFETSCSRYP